MFDPQLVSMANLTFSLPSDLFSGSIGPLILLFIISNSLVPAAQQDGEQKCYPLAGLGVNIALLNE